MKGVLAAVLTPMREDLSVDRAAFAAHSRRLLDAGCHGLAIFGTTGEANSLSVDERIEAWQGLVEDGIPADVMLPGTGACALPDAVRLSRAALALGASGVLALPPFYYKGVSDDRLRVFLYHIPPMAQVGFTPELIGRLLDAYPGVVAGTKDSEGDAARVERVCREYPQLAVFAGSERLLLDTLRWGGAGCISATVNVTARQTRDVYDLHEAGRDADADAEQARLTEARRFLEGFPPIPALKAIMREATGDDVWSNLRPPLDALDERRVSELLARLPAAVTPYHGARRRTARLP
jgi:4-hydroxy-tetrahydrodipicolinate synthase